MSWASKRMPGSWLALHIPFILFSNLGDSFLKIFESWLWSEAKISSLLHFWLINNIWYLHTLGKSRNHAKHGIRLSHYILAQSRGRQFRKEILLSPPLLPHPETFKFFFVIRVERKKVDALHKIVAFLQGADLHEHWKKSWRRRDVDYSS